MKLKQALLLAGTTLLLAACAGSSDDDVDAQASSNKVPASASVSVASYTLYASTLQNSEWQQPLDVAEVVPPTSETAAPSTVN